MWTTTTIAQKRRRDKDNKKAVPNRYHIKEEGVSKERGDKMSSITKTKAK